jgi:hypothetical protein
MFWFVPNNSHPVWNFTYVAYSKTLFEINSPLPFRLSLFYINLAKHNDHINNIGYILYYIYVDLTG